MRDIVRGKMGFMGNTVTEERVLCFCMVMEEGSIVGGGEAEKRGEHEVYSWKRQRGVQA